MDFNILYYVFIFLILFIALFGLLINHLEHYLPLIITRSYRYGKFSAKTHHVMVAKFEVPKKWFKHFYAFAAPTMTITLCLTIHKYYYNGDTPEILIALLDTFLGSSRKALIPAENVILATVVCNIHCWKRLYESYCVCVFSDQKINIFHYLVGYIHYLGIPLCIIGESEGFVKDSHTNLFTHRLSTIDLVCAFIFLWSTYMQFKCNVVLAKPRKNNHGDVVSLKHKVPHDGLFKYISGALHFTEILIYIMVSVILWQASTFHVITIWVIANQVESAILTHKWYHETFKNYPKERKVLIPYIW